MDDTVANMLPNIITPICAPLVGAATHTSVKPPLAARRLPALTRSGLLVLALLSAPAVHAQALDPADIAEGASLYRQKANCQACHGWAGDGRKMDTQMPDGANLRETKLDRQTLITTIKCGRPGREMPAYDRLAYSDGRCFGLRQQDLRARQLQLPDPPATLVQREIEAIADFLFAKVVGKGLMDRAKCIEYWASDVETCKDFPN